MNFGALARLIAAILAGHVGGGKTLLLDAANIWATNVGYQLPNRGFSQIAHYLRCYANAPKG